MIQGQASFIYFFFFYCLAFLLLGNHLAMVFCPRLLLQSNKLEDLKAGAFSHTGFSAGHTSLDS